MLATLCVIGGYAVGPRERILAQSTRRETIR
jgi:hypothetical protein